MNFGYQDAFAQDAFANSHFGYGYTAYADRAAKLVAFVNDAKAQAQKDPSVTTMSGLRELFSRAVRLSRLDSSTKAQNYFTQSLLSIRPEGPAGTRNSRSEVLQAIHAFENGSRRKDVDPSVVAAEYLKAMDVLGKIKYAEIDGQQGGTSGTSRRPQIAQTDAQYLADLERGGPKKPGFKEWWEKNKKWVIGGSVGIVLLMGIGYFATGKKKIGTKVPSTFTPRKRKRTR